VDRRIGDVRAASIRVIFRRLCQAEVQDLHGPVVGDLDVGGLQVAMNDPEVVRRDESLGDLLRDRERVPSLQKSVGGLRVRGRGPVECSLQEPLQCGSGLVDRSRCWKNRLLRGAH
jgi:hypothetical protein